jgi:hypothetical protein
VTRLRLGAWLCGGPGVVGWDINESFSEVGSVGHDGVNQHSPCQRPRIVAESLPETEAQIVTTALKGGDTPHIERGQSSGCLQRPTTLGR